jgi:hypothetical protein
VFSLLGVYTLNPDSINLGEVHWYQGFVDPEGQGPYIQRLRERLASYAAPKRLV